MVKDGWDGGIGSLIDGPSREDGRWQKRMVYLYINLSITGEGGLLGGFPPYEKTGLTGPVSIYKLLPEVSDRRRNISGLFVMIRTASPTHGRVNVSHRFLLGQILKSKSSLA